MNWHDRAMKVEDNLGWLSRISAPCDFDVVGMDFDPERAVALRPPDGSSVLALEPIDEVRLRVVTDKARWVLTGKTLVDMRIEPEADRPLTPGPGGVG